MNIRVSFDLAHNIFLRKIAQSKEIWWNGV